MRGRLGTICAVLTVLVAGTALPAGAQAPDPGDPLRGRQWGLAQVRAEQAWARSRGEGARIAVIDTGVDRAHPDLAANLGEGATFLRCAENGVTPDDEGSCGDGDWDSGPEGEGTDGRGTAAAGIIGAVAGNGEGIAGVAPDATLLPVRAQPYPTVAFQADTGAALRWAAKRAQVIYLGATTLAGFQPLARDLPLEALQAVRGAVAAGAVVVLTATGEDGNEACGPPDLDARILCVGPSDVDGNRRSAYLWGVERDLSAVLAPGGGMTENEFGLGETAMVCDREVVSTTAAGVLQLGGGCGLPDGYRASDSPALAAAHVAGVAGLLAGMGCNQQEILHLVRATARNPLTGARGTWSPTHAYGLVDADAATKAAAGLCVEEAAPPEDAPTCTTTASEDFEDGAVPPGWSVRTAANPGGTPAWAAVRGPGTAGWQLRSDGSGAAAKDDRLISPPLPVARRTAVSFTHRFALEDQRDGGVLEYSVDGGASWVPVEVGRFTAGGYNGTVAPDAASPLAGRSAWTGLPRTSELAAPARASVYFDDLAGQTLQLSWRLVQDAGTASTAGGGWEIDALTVLDVSGPECTEEATDPLRQYQWGFDQVRAGGAWELARGRGVTLAIVDSGLDLAHPEFRGRIVGGNTFLGCGDKGCGDGGWLSGTDPTGSFHGTWVAGIAAASGDDGIGVAGVAPATDLLAVRVLNGRGEGSGTDVGYGIRWAVDQGADVINLSLGARSGAQLLSPVLPPAAEQAITYAISRGVVVVGAAGNDPFPLCSSPAWAEGTLCTTATDRRALKAAYSNLGVKPDRRTVAAPGGSLLLACGEGVLGPQPPGTSLERCGYSPNADYDEHSGTSGASPHVAGVAALLRGLGCTAAQTVNLIGDTARHPLTDARGGWTAEYGYGIVDAAAATRAALDVCEPPAPDPDPDPTPDPEPGCLTTSVEGFETGIPAGWRVQTAANADGTPAWQATADPYIRGWEVESAATGRGAKDDRLVTAPLEVTSRTRLELLHRFTLESGRDGGVVEVSTDGGASWAPLGADRFGTGRYNGTIAAGAASPIAGQAAWTGQSSGDYAGRVTSTADLSHLAGREVLLSFRLVQDDVRTDATPGTGWAIDDVQLVNVHDAACAEDGGCTADVYEGFGSGVPPGWQVDTARNDDSTGAWRADTLPPSNLFGRVSTAASGRGAKDDRLVSAPFVPTGTSRVRFLNSLLGEAGWDGGVLEVSADGGATWADVGPERLLGAGYNGTIAADAASPLAGRPAWTAPTSTLVADYHLAGGWSGASLGDWAGQTIRLRWRWVQDGLRTASTPGDRWLIDSVTLTAVRTGGSCA